VDININTTYSEHFTHGLVDEFIVIAFGGLV
jgi:hypothetical protein